MLCSSARLVRVAVLAMAITAVTGQSPVSAPAPSLVPAVKSYDLHITVGEKAPDCFQRLVYLINGEFAPQLNVTQGQILEVNVFNDVAEGFPSVADGISIHWHGFSMRGAEWYDGVAHVSQCPIPRGSNFTYRFQVNEAPGTYFYHGHSGLERVDGLGGPLIVLPAGQDPFAGLYDEERILYLNDWYHDVEALLTFATSRPFDDSKVTNTSGSRVWVDTPQAVLINGQGFYGDCTQGAGGSAVPPACNVTTLAVPKGRSTFQPFAAASNPGCSHYQLSVDPGKTYRLRVINAGYLAYLSLILEGHNMTIIAADATPTEPLNVSTLDLNLGQRYDVLLTANQEPRNYYMTAQPQYRNGAPSGFGFISYSTANASILPPTPTPSPSNLTAPWTLAQTNQVVSSSALFSPDVSIASVALPTNMTSLAVPEPNVFVRMNVSQPVLPNGQLHWAFNNIATYKTPACGTLLDNLYSNTSYMSANTVQLGASQPVDYSLKQVGTPLDQPQIYNEQEVVGLIKNPVTGQLFVDIQMGDVVEVVIQNNPGNSSGGDMYLETAAPALLAGRGAQEQHPMHLHGHHFFLVATGNGTWNESSVASYNLKNPIYRDSYTVPRGGWAAIRFKADNPGTWQLHCHIAWHLYMGQMIVFSEAIDQVSDAPPNMPVCKDTCTLNFAGWALDYVKQKYGSSGFF